jgi:hypothetical protein
MEYGGHQAKNCRPTRGEADLQRRVLGAQSQTQPEKAEDKHSKVSGAGPMIPGVLVCAVRPAGRSLVLRVADALRRVAE